MWTTATQPVVQYLGGQPVVAWVNDANRSLASVDDRRIALRVLDGASPVLAPSELPARVIEFSLAAAGSGAPRLAITQAEPEAGLLDNRHVLLAAMLNQGASAQADQAIAPGLSSPGQLFAAGAWTVAPVLDSHGRNILAAKLVVTVDDAGRATITFRGMGLGPLPDGRRIAFPQDTAGVLMGTGELAQVALDAPQGGLETAAATGRDPRYLSTDGAVYWEVAAAYEPVSQSTLVLSTKGPLPSPQADAASTASIAAAPLAPVAEGAPVVFAAVPQLPDFSVAALTPSARYPQAGQPISVAVQLRNDGVPWGCRDLSCIPYWMYVVATWDGGPGLGEAAGSTRIVWLDAGQPVTLTIPLAPPSAGFDQAHTLFVTVNPRQVPAESNGANNSRSAVIGGLPAPADVAAAAQTGRRTVFLR